MRSLGRGRQFSCGLVLSRLNDQLIRRAAAQMLDSQTARNIPNPGLHKKVEMQLSRQRRGDRNKEEYHTCLLHKAYRRQYSSLPFVFSYWGFRHSPGNVLGHVSSNISAFVSMTGFRVTVNHLAKIFIVIALQLCLLSQVVSDACTLCVYVSSGGCDAQESSFWVE